jgi:acyl carrier protein phosphodiesterase
LNYLAHVFLSGDDKELLLGNFIADAVKGKQMDLYAPGVIKGIRLHRLIDSYTDTHPVVAETKARLRPGYKKYAPVIADLYYDHFLAKNFQVYSSIALPVFTTSVYELIQQYYETLPDRVQQFFPYMMRQDWLRSYSTIDGIGQALSGLSRRTTFTSGMETASTELRRNYEAYQHDFTTFFPELIDYVERVKGEL